MSATALKFTISGKVAFFKKPDVNEKVYFTYNNIHRIALLGMLGAIIGLDGYKSYKLFGEDPSDFPEFYDKLNLLKVSIIPNAKRGYFSKKIQYFNNSIGFASKEEGGNLMVKEQWLENPSWTVYLLKGDADDNVWNKLQEYILVGKCVYVPYLGKNDFPAILSNCTKLELCGGEFDHIDSIFYGELDQVDDLSETGEELPFLFREMSPVTLASKYNFYQYKRSIFTNYKLSSSTGLTLFSDKDKVLCFS